MQHEKLLFSQSVDIHYVSSIINTMLSDSQLKFLADVLVTIGEVSLASLIIPYFTSTGMELFYLFVAIVLLAIAILVYPTLRNRSNR